MKKTECRKPESVIIMTGLQSICLIVAAAADWLIPGAAGTAAGAVSCLLCMILHRDKPALAGLKTGFILVSLLQKNLWSLTTAFLMIFDHIFQNTAEKENSHGSHQ